MIAEVEAVRKKWDLQEKPSVKQKIANWGKLNPPPPDISFALGRKQERQEWSRKRREEIPEAIVTSTLRYDLPFLLYCEHFPEKHWLEIPSTERRSIAKGCDPDRKLGKPLLDPERLEATPMHIQTLDERLNGLLSSLLPGSNEYVLSVSWERSDRKLTDDFKHWLKKSRPKDEPGLQLSKHSPSRRTTAKELLKNLSAFRLSRHFGGNVPAAKDFYYQILEKFLYRDEPAWRKAEEKARQEIKRFNQLRK